jgi:hypothetical protein
MRPNSSKPKAASGPTGQNWRERYPLTHLLPAALGVTLLGNARLRQADEFRKWRIRSAGSARQRRSERRHGRAAVPIEFAQVDVADGAASRAARLPPIGIKPVIGKEKLHVAALCCWHAQPASRNNQADLKDKSSTGQSLPAAL